MPHKLAMTGGLDSCTRPCSAARCGLMCFPTRPPKRSQEPRRPEGPAGVIVGPAAEGKFDVAASGEVKTFTEEISLSGSTKITAGTGVTHGRHQECDDSKVTNMSDSVSTRGLSYLAAGQVLQKNEANV